ncbi:MAG TPA: A24 family peptidase [Arachnia sp.]|nr:A24 family peptidase [Arachnia sp.]HMT85469.1 A24 family peptidase [Arachnia sp.]
MWAVSGATAVVAALVLAVAVPRLPAPSLLDEDDPVPDYPALATGRAIAGLLVATFAVAQVIWLVPPAAWPLWVPYLALGAPLVYVDLRTTYLPIVLHRLARTAMLIALIPLAVLLPSAALAAILGAVVFRGLFWLVWRFSRSFGFGDVRLAALMGAVAAPSGIGSALAALFLGTLMGAVAGLVHALVRRRRGGPASFAYGPWLWLGPVAAVAISGW